MSEHRFLYRDGIQELFRKHVKGAKHVYYVGLPPKTVFRHHRQLWWKEICDELGVKYTVIEVFKPWAEELKSEGFNVVCVDVLDYVPDIKESLLLWSHGPEHVERDAFESNLHKLASRYNGVIVAMPYGVWEQSSSINPHEFHLWHAYPEDLKSMGFTDIGTNGPKDGKGDLYGFYKI